MFSNFTLNDWLLLGYAGIPLLMLVFRNHPGKIAFLAMVFSFVVAGLFARKDVSAAYVMLAVAAFWAVATFIYYRRWRRLHPRKPKVKVVKVKSV